LCGSAERPRADKVSASNERPLVGELGGRSRARIGPTGTVVPEERTWRLDWWVGADDRWRVPQRETAVRQTLLGDSPVVQTSMRVPGGDAIHRVYGVAGPGSLLVVEIENASPAPFVVALVVGCMQGVALDGTRVLLDGRPGLLTTRAPSRWAVERRGGTEIEVCSGAARSGPFPPTRSRAGTAEAAFLHPVAHRTTLRAALVLAPGRPDVSGVDLTRLPTADDAVRGWTAQLDRGTRVVLPDERLAALVRAARAQVLLAGTRRAPIGIDVAALEDWGFDADAEEGWRRLSLRERRRAARRSAMPASWADVQAAAGGSALLLAVRSLLVHERDDVVTLLAELPPAWLGQPIEVHDAPTRVGPVSFAVRWHAERPALLWDVPEGVTVRAPGLDPDWSSTEQAGEALLRGIATTA
jgi:hypothetical protein